MWLFLGRGLPASFCKEPNWNLQWAHARSSSTRTLESIFPEDRGAQTPRGQRKGPWGWDSSHTTAPCRECVSMGACRLSLRPGCCLVLRHRSGRPPREPKDTAPSLRSAPPGPTWPACPAWQGHTEHTEALCGRPEMAPRLSSAECLRTRARLAQLGQRFGVRDSG